MRIDVVTSIPGIREGAPFRFCEKLDISFDVWNFYNDEMRREWLFDLKEAGTISRIYDKFTGIGNEGGSGYAHVRGKEAAAEVDDRLLDSSLDRELYLNVCSPEARKFIEELLTGKRESYPSISIHSEETISWRKECQCAQRRKDRTEAEGLESSVLLRRQRHLTPVPFVPVGERRWLQRIEGTSLI